MKLTNKFIREFFSYKRPHASATEHEWIERYILPALGDDWWQDAAGNIHYDNRGNTKARTLFVSHTDTVHPHAGRQKVSVGKDNIVRVVDGECLGSDDGSGALVLLALIHAKVPAYYIFTRCEERGGVGAKHLADTYPELLAQFDRAVAFDRRGTSSVISHQGWGRCCSDKFAEGLSDALSTDTLMYAPDDGGVYTDTAEFVEIIPECTNISVGYNKEHSVNETQDLAHLRDLITHAVTMDWEALPVERDPAVKDDLNHYPSMHYDTTLYSSGWEGSLSKFSDYNMTVYDACEEAIRGECDYLLYLIAEAMNPADPDEVYEQIWNMPLPEYLIQNCLRQVDYAEDDVQTERALVDLYQAVINDNVYQ